MIDQTIRRAMTDGNNRKSRVRGRILRERRRTNYKKIGHVPMLKPGVNHALLRRCPHDRPTLDMRRAIRPGVVMMECAVPATGKTSFDQLRAGNLRDHFND